MRVRGALAAVLCGGCRGCRHRPRAGRSDQPPVDPQVVDVPPPPPPPAPWEPPPVVMPPPPAPDPGDLAHSRLPATAPPLVDPAAAPAPAPAAQLGSGPFRPCRSRAPTPARSRARTARPIGDPVFAPRFNPSMGPLVGVAKPIIDFQRPIANPRAGRAGGDPHLVEPAGAGERSTGPPTHPGSLAAVQLLARPAPWSTSTPAARGPASGSATR